MTHPWSDLRWWNSGERQAAEEKIDDLFERGIACSPSKGLLYKALSATPEREVRVAIIGQDPYPAVDMATGVAFSIPKDVGPSRFPHTLKIIFGEYTKDLGLPSPTSGDLSRWTEQGVLLWNSVLCCKAGQPLSCDWDEWGYLTREIITRLSDRGIVFALLGNVAARNESLINPRNNRIIRTSHPSPRGIRASKTPFTGSRLFSTINARLREVGRGSVDWELKDEEFKPGDIGQGYIPPTGVVRGNVLPNITGADLGGLKRQATSPNIYTSLLF